MEIIDNKTGRPLAHYRERFVSANPEELGAKGIAEYNSEAKRFTISVMGRPYFVRWPETEFLTTPIFLDSVPSISASTSSPEGVDAHTTPSVIARRAQAHHSAASTNNTNGNGLLFMPEISPELEILLLRIILEGITLPALTGFLAYQELPKGAAYLPAFNRRCTQRLARQFSCAQELEQACCALGAHIITSKADAACEFEFITGVFVQFLFWEGDDEFPAQAQILFSNNVVSFFTSEDMVVISEIIIRALSLGYVI